MKIANIEQGTDEGKEALSFDIPCSVLVILPLSPMLMGLTKKGKYAIFKQETRSIRYIDLPANLHHPDKIYL